MRLRWLHIHRDYDYQVVNVHRYEQCRCGARRTSRHYSNMDGPVACGWPDTRDRHGELQWTSGWVAPPPGGWSTDGYPTGHLPGSAG